MLREEYFFGPFTTRKISSSPPAKIRPVGHSHTTGQRQDPRYQPDICPRRYLLVKNRGKEQPDTYLAPFLPYLQIVKST